MPVTSGFSGFPHFTQRLLLTTSTYSFYFIFFYAKREIIFRKRTHGVWKRWVQICFYFLLNYKKKVVILLSYFCMTKSSKSQQGGLAPSSFRTTGGVHELVARAVRGECVRHRSNVKVGGFIAPHSFIYTTRANTAHEIAEQIRARKPARPHNKVRRAWIWDLR